MTSGVRFRDHSAFHAGVIRLAVAGAALGLGQYLLGFITPMDGATARVIWLAISATVLGLAALPPTRKRLLPLSLMGFALGLGGALAMQALAAGKPNYPWFGVGLYGVTVGILAGRDLQRRPRVVLALLSGATVALGTWVVATLRGGAPLASYVPDFVAEPLYGAAFGFLVSTALVVRQISMRQDPVAQAMDEARPLLAGEMLELAEQALTLYGRIKEALRHRRDKGNEAEPALHQAVERLALKVLAMGRRWREVELGAGATSADDLVQRIAALDEKIAASRDEVARRQYRSARDALSTQLGYLQQLSRNRERVVARVHNYLATLERLHLALLNHRGADAAELADEVQPILDQLDDKGNEMDFSAASVDEVLRATCDQESAGESAAATHAATSDAAAAEQHGASEAPAEADDVDGESQLAARSFVV